jgi:molybdenum cofactor guanylyltransferase
MQGLAMVETNWVLLLACDLPNLRLEILQEWISQLNTIPENYLAALVQNNYIWQPLCGFYRRRCLPELKQYIEQGGRSFQRWLEPYPVHVLPLPDSQMLFNFNKNSPEFLKKSGC